MTGFFDKLIAEVRRFENNLLNWAIREYDENPINFTKWGLSKELIAECEDENELLHQARIIFCKENNIYIEDYNKLYNFGGRCVYNEDGEIIGLTTENY